MASMWELINCGSNQLFVLPSFRSYHRLFRETSKLQRHLTLRQRFGYSFIVEDWPRSRLLPKRPIGLSLHWPTSKWPASTLLSDCFLGDASYKHMLGLSIPGLVFQKQCLCAVHLLKLSHDVLLERSPGRHNLQSVA